MLPTLAPGTLFAAALVAFLGIVEAVPEIVVSLLESVRSLVNQGIDVLKNSDNLFFKAAGYMIEGLVNGIIDGVEMVVNAIGQVIDSALGWARSLLGIASPSKVFKSIGGFVSEGFADGIADKAHEAVGAMKDMANDVVDAAKMDLPAIEVPVGFDTRKLSGAVGLGGFGFSLAMAGAGSPAGNATNNYYTIEKVDLSGYLAAVKAAETLWGNVRRQIRMR